MARVYDAAGNWHDDETGEYHSCKRTGFLGLGGSTCVTWTHTRNGSDSNPTGKQLELHMNGWLQDLFGGGVQTASLPRRTRGAAHGVTVPSKYLEDDVEHLDEAASGVTRATMGALQKQMRSAGFKGALVSGYGVGAGRSGFVVKYQGKDYYFSIDEDPHRGHTVESRQARRLVPHGDNMQSNGLREADKRVIKAFVAERPASSNLLETDGVKLEKIGMGGETVAYWVDGRIAVVSTESAKSDESILRLISKEAGPGVVDFSYARKGHRVHTHGASGRSPHAGASQRELEHLETILRRHGYDQADARKLQAEGMGPTELEGRIVHHPGDLERTHGMKRLNRNGHTPNARGVYHGTGVAKNDMVLHQDHHGRWRIDLVTSAGGNHTDVTGRSPTPGSRPNSGYDSAEQAFQAALDVQRTRGIRGKSHVWVQQGDELHDYVPEEARLDDPVPSVLARNGRRAGILSDGTRVNVYYEEGSGEPWTVVPHGEDWDAQERRGMRQMLGMSETATGISQWTEGQEGRHLGRSVPWDAVPDNIKRHIERRVAQDSNMVANPRKRTTKKSAPVAETREQRIAREWEKAEDAGLVRIQADPEYENYFDVYGEPDSPEERAEQEELIERHGVYHVYSQYKSQDSGDWETADAVGMIFGNDLGDDNPYVLDMKESALQNVFGGHTPNARGSVANEHSVRELSLYIENEYSLVGAPNSRGKAIHENLLRKVKSGKYDKALAPKAWQYLIDEGAKKYTKEFGGGGTQIFTVADRRQVAEEYARAWEEENLR